LNKQLLVQYLAVIVWTPGGFTPSTPANAPPYSRNPGSTPTGHSRVYLSRTLCTLSTLLISLVVQLLNTAGGPRDSIRSTMTMLVPYALQQGRVSDRRIAWMPVGLASCYASPRWHNTSYTDRPTRSTQYTASHATTHHDCNDGHSTSRDDNCIRSASWHWQNAQLQRRQLKIDKQSET